MPVTVFWHCGQCTQAAVMGFCGGVSSCLLQLPVTRKARSTVWHFLTSSPRAAARKLPLPSAETCRLFLPPTEFLLLKIIHCRWLTAWLLDIPEPESSDAQMSHRSCARDYSPLEWWWAWPQPQRTAHSYSFYLFLHSRSSKIKDAICSLWLPFWSLVTSWPRCPL